MPKKNVEVEVEVNDGGYRMFTTEISGYDLHSFEFAVEDKSFYYEPLLISKQVVNGMNLKFIATAIPKKYSRVAPWFLVEVDIFRSLQGEVTFNKVGVFESPEVIEGFSGLFGAFSMFSTDISTFDLLGFEYVLEDKEFTYEPLLISTQVLAGSNLKFIAVAIPKKASKVAPWHYVEVDIFKSLQAEFRLGSIHSIEVDFDFPAPKKS